MVGSLEVAPGDALGGLGVAEIQNALLSPGMMNLQCLIQARQWSVAR
jgi:hypothetical protein